MKKKYYINLKKHLYNKIMKPEDIAHILNIKPKKGEDKKKVR